MDHRSEKVIRAYLFALNWKEDAKDWHTFKDRNVRFFKEMANQLGGSSATLFSFAKLLNDVGSRYLPHGVHWLAIILKENDHSKKTSPDANSIFYLNTYMRKFLNRERATVRRSPELMADTLIVLNFLIEEGEVSGYMLRESIV